jgi:hypothetical protein
MSSTSKAAPRVRVPAKAHGVDKAFEDAAAQALARSDDNMRTSQNSSAMHNARGVAVKGGVGRSLGVFSQSGAGGGSARAGLAPRAGGQENLGHRLGLAEHIKVDDRLKDGQGGQRRGRCALRIGTGWIWVDAVRMVGWVMRPWVVAHR